MLSILLAFLAGLLGILIVRSNSWRLNKRLPPGTMGWPVIGELLTYVPKVRSEKAYEFTRQKEAKYGPIFKTSLLSGSTIVLTDAEGVKFVLQNEGTLFESGYPRSLKNVIGSYSMLFQHGDFHKRMHAMLKRFVSSTPLKKHLTQEIEGLTRKAMNAWPRNQKIPLQDESQTVIHNFIMKQLFGLDPGELSKTISIEFKKLMMGIIGLPYMIPGTPYYAAMKARERLFAIIKGMVDERRAAPDAKYKDILQCLIEERQEGEPDQVIIDNALICIANAETVPSAILTLSIKYLTECPDALKEIREENFCARKGKRPGEGLAWNEYMSLEFTQGVINETLRMANGAQAVTRRALKDVEYRGYIIPKDWTVLPYFLNIHFDEKVYPNPASFHPWRWLEKNIPSSYFLPFGGGTRICPGQELTRLQTAVYLHHFVTQFKWELEQDKVINFPIVSLKKRLPIVLHDL